MVDKNQTLKSPIDFFSDFLEKIGTSEKGTVLVNINHYKRGIYNGSIQEFFERMYPFYYDSKKHYVDFNKVTYSKFITVLRQISHKNQVAYEYKIKYNHSKHYIEYTFTLPTDVSPGAEVVTDPSSKIECTETLEID
jgi:hypothetical protein